MSDSLATFEAGQTLVRIDESGAVDAVQHRARPALRYLSLGLPEDPGTALTRTGITVDADEVEVALGHSSGLAVTVRHSFVAGWRFRVVLSNAGHRSCRLRLRMPLGLGPGAVGRAVAEGAEAELFVQPADGRGPLLVGRLRQGSIAEIGEHGLVLPEVVLDPGGRYVLAWEWAWLPRPSAYVRSWPTIRPTATTGLRGQALLLPAGPDVAFVAPPALRVEEVEDGYELTAEEPCSASVELRSVRGVRTIELTWTRTPQEELGRAATDALAQARRSAGVALLPGIQAALVVQQAETAELLDDPDEARDALDLYTARLDETLLDETDLVLRALFLCGEHARIGDLGLLEDASRSVLRVARPIPGLGLVATRVCVARLLAGLSPQPVMDRLQTLAGELGEGVELPDDPMADRTEIAAAAELLAVTRSTAPVGLGGPAPDRDPLLGLALALGAELGGGLPGGPVEPLSVERLGHLLAILAVLPEDLAAPTRRFWSVSPRDLAERTTPTLVARLAGLRPGPGHVWLGLLVGAG